MYAHGTARGRRLAAALALALAACASDKASVPRRVSSTDLATPRAAAATGAAPSASVPAVARLDGKPIDAAELLASLVYSDTRGVRDALDRLVFSRLYRGEAGRLGLVPDADALRDRYREAVVDIESALDGASLDDFVATKLGLDPLQYRERVRADVELEYLATRVVRAFTLSQEWLELSGIVTDDEAAAQAVVARLTAGEPFERVAAEVSVDASGQNGGRFPPLLRNASELSRQAFELEPGKVGAPLQVGDHWLVALVEERHAPLVGGWPEVGPAVERSLVERPVEEPESWAWRAEMVRRHQVDFQPLQDLLGAAVAQ